MTNQEDSGLEKEGTPEGQPVVSSSQSVQPDSLEGNATVSALMQNPEFQEWISGMVSTETQRTKDRRFNKLEGQVSKLVDRVKQLQDEGATESMAKFLVEQEVAAGKFEPEPEQTPIVADAANVPVSTYLSILGSMGLTGAEPEVEKVLKADLPFDQQVAKFAQIAATKSAKSAPHSPADEGNQAGSNVGQKMPQGGGGEPPPPRPDLWQQYHQELSKLPQGDIDAIDRLQRKYREKGLDIY